MISSLNSSRNGAGTRISFNDGAGVFTDTDMIAGFDNFAHTAALGDLDNDSGLDLVLLIGNLRHTRTLLNDGAFYYAETNQILGDAWGSRSVALVDVNNDNFLDIVLTRALTRWTEGERAMVYLPEYLSVSTFETRRTNIANLYQRSTECRRISTTNF